MAVSARMRLAIQVGPEWRTFGEDLKSSRALMRTTMREAALQVAPQMASAAKTLAATYPIRAGGAMSQQSRVVESIRVQAAKRSVSLVTGTSGKAGTAAFAAGAEWGSARYRQFLPPTKEGYFLWRAAKGKEKAVLAAYEAAIDKSMRKAFPS
jgi:hypothetical protein